MVEGKTFLRFHIFVSHHMSRTYFVIDVQANCELIFNYHLKMHCINFCISFFSLNKIKTQLFRTVS